MTKRIKIGALCFLALALIYFIPALGIPYKICFPVLTLAAFSIGVLPWEITLALLFGGVGDLMGAMHLQMGQIGFFAVGHVFYIIFLYKIAIRGIKNLRKGPDCHGSSLIMYFAGSLVICAAILFTVLKFVVPCIESPVVHIGGICYGSIICLMLLAALMTRKPGYIIAACLFVASDYILSWDRFVEPTGREYIFLGLPVIRYYIMVPYYAAQLLFYLFVAKYTSKK